jgi:arylsulfatase A
VKTIPALCSFLICTFVWALEKPNIVLIYADDMGIDSVRAFNEKLGLETPHLDRLASEGMSFMDAHSASGVCSPSRYSLLTGRYHWRSRLKRAIVNKWERPLIEKGRLTLPSMLKKEGYDTCMIGKWHLGHNWPKKGGGFTNQAQEIDFSGPITGGPNAIGFDYWFGDDVPNWPPFAWQENERLLGIPTTDARQLKLTQYVGVSNGPAVEGWSLQAVLPEYAKRCSSYIRERANKKIPFFLYFPMPSPHTPIVPDSQWKGKSGLGDYADFLLETDWAVGEVLRALQETGQENNTLVIFTTDNGTSPKADLEALKKQGVHLCENWRGYKADIYEGGHRVPFIVRWPGQISPDTRSDEIIVQTDLLATLAEIINHRIPADAGEDSVSLWPLLSGKRKTDAPLHEAIISQSSAGKFAVRMGKWKLLFSRGSGGWSPPTEGTAIKMGLPIGQLYDLDTDPKESNNLHSKHPKVVERLTAVFRQFVENGRSTPGPKQPNHHGTHWESIPWPKGK